VTEHTNNTTQRGRS